MKKWFGILLFGVVLVSIQACGPKYEAEESCNFVQNGNMQRVSWRKDVPIKLYVHNSVPSEYWGAIERAIATWNKSLGKPIIEVVAFGIGGASSPARDGDSVIYWMDTWDSDRSSEQARTTIYWTGEQIYEADIKINAANFTFSADSKNIQGVDMESLILHELGHVVGLGHTSEAGSVMNVSLAAGANRRQLSPSDQKSLQCEY